MSVVRAHKLPQRQLKKTVVNATHEAPFRIEMRWPNGRIRGSRVSCVLHQTSVLTDCAACGLSPSSADRTSGPQTVHLFGVVLGGELRRPSREGTFSVSAPAQVTGCVCDALSTVNDLLGTQGKTRAPPIFLPTLTSRAKYTWECSRSKMPLQTKISHDEMRPGSASSKHCAPHRGTRDASLD